MRTRGPLLTLLAVLAIGGVLFAVNTVAVGGGEPAAVAPAAQQAQAPAAADAYGYDYAAPQAAPQTAPQAAPQAAPAAPQQAAPQAPAVAGAFAGRSAGNEVTLAVGVQGDRVIAYVCDGKKIEAWLEGTLTNGSAQLTGADGELTATVTGSAVLGTVAVGQKSWPFSAQPGDAPSGRALDRAVLKRLGNA